jgi:hypothetical protein
MPQDAHWGKQEYVPSVKSAWDRVEEDIYLGDLISSDGKNRKNAEKRIGPSGVRAPAQQSGH